MFDHYNTKEEKYKSSPDTLVIAGSARLPENVTAKHVFGYLTIELEIDPVDSRIVNVSCTLLPSLGKKMLRNALVGNEIEEGIKNAVIQLEDRFAGATKKAMIAALQDTHERYKKFLKILNTRSLSHSPLPVEV